MKVLIVSLIFMAATAAANASGLYRDDDSLSRAHAAFALGDLPSGISELKNTLMNSPDDELIKKNALALYAHVKAQSESKGLPADWTLPAVFKSMKIASRHVQSDQLYYQMQVSGEIKELGLIRQMKVTKYPHQVIMDKTGNVGKYEEDVSAQGENEYSLRSARMSQPLALGLYTIECELTSGEKVEGWFIIDQDMNSTATPELNSPSVDQVLTTGTPTFQWNNFQSPQYKPYEMRSMWIGISRTDLGEGWVKRWEKWMRSPTLEQLTVGTMAPDAGENELEVGKYTFALHFHEVSKFGPILLYRDSVTYRPFRIQK